MEPNQEQCNILYRQLLTKKMTSGKSIKSCDSKENYLSCNGMTQNSAIACSQNCNSCVIAAALNTQDVRARDLTVRQSHWNPFSDSATIEPGLQTCTGKPKLSCHQLEQNVSLPHIYREIDSSAVISPPENGREAANC